MSTMADKSAYVGRWKIVETYDEQNQLVTLPEGDFYLQLAESDNSADNFLSAYIKVGNSMRSRITFLGESSSGIGDTISVGAVMSTMMMPPDSLFRLETYFTNTLPKMNLIEKETVDGTTQLIFLGQGKIVCEETAE